MRSSSGRAGLRADRFLVAGLAILLLGSALSLRDIDGRWPVLIHSVLAAIVALRLLLRHQRHPFAVLLAMTALAWCAAQVLRLLAGDRQLALWLVVIAASIASVTTLRFLIVTHMRQARMQQASLLADLFTIATALVGIEWFALQQLSARSTRWEQLFLLVLLALPVSVAITHIIHEQRSRRERISIAVGALLLVSFGIALVIDSAWAVWDLTAALGLLFMLYGMAGEPLPTTRVEASMRWPSSLRLVPTLLVTLSFGMAVGYGSADRWRGGDILVAALLAIAVGLRQVLSIAEERRLTRFIASQGQAIHHQALHDPLTDLANRDLFYDRLEHALILRQRSPAPLAVIHIDISDFKAINERYGHATGDALLVALSDRMSTWVRPTDTVARLGGDEFAILVDGSQDAAMVVARRLAQEIGNGFEISGRLVAVDVSIGVATLSKVDEDARESVNRLMNEADRAMHRSRRDPFKTIFVNELS